MTKETAIKYLETLYHSTSQSEVDKAMYDGIKKYIDKSEVTNVKETEEYLNMERQWFFEHQLCDIYKNRVRKAATILGGKYD